jgi:hypothetical protein
MTMRCSIRRMMALVLLSAIATAFLRSADDGCGGLFKMSAGAFGVAALGATVTRGRRRAFLAGRAASGLGYLVFCLGPGVPLRVYKGLPTTRLLDYVGPRLGHPYRPVGGCYYDSQITTKKPLPIPSAPAGGPGSSIEFQCFGHAAFALASSLVGGLVAVSRIPDRPRAGTDDVRRGQRGDGGVDAEEEAGDRRGPAASNFLPSAVGGLRRRGIGRWMRRGGWPATTRDRCGTTSRASGL